ncbi:MAG: GNAT family N-acetyltransferase [Chloroflexi bacterium]|nr:GNAT family N-acetyltransferase [Chloroflexota bacterium]
MTTPPPTSNPAIVVREVDAASWPDFERLFESRGGPRWCWCRMWRRDAEGRMPHDRAHMKEAMRKRIAGGGRVGLLAYVDGEPAAWCSVAPRETFVGLGGVEEQGEDESTVWSLTCFYVRNAFRHRRLMDRLVEEASRHARENGASVIEAYPVPLDGPSYRFCGFIPVFEAHGFSEVGRAGTRRHVMRRSLG